MPPGWTAVHRAVVISDGGVAASKENLGVAYIGPFGPFHFLRRGMVLKMAFNVFVIHVAKLNKKDVQVKKTLKSPKVLFLFFDY